MSQGELTPKEVGGFRILRRLASGATSDVLLARAEGPHGFQRVVALKVLLGRSKTNPEFETNFAAEASAYARLSHPAVVKLYDFFSADGQLVMVLEFVDGLPLHKLRAMLAISGERIEDKAALFLGLRVFSALAAAHTARDPARGEFAPVIHYDVNPSNILVPWDGHVKLGDFGIARAAGIQSDSRSGFIKGTYGYTAPEQVANKDVTVRADVYSAALILWELLARRKAVQRGTLNDAQVLNAMAHPEFPALELLRPDLDAPIRSAIRRALEPDPEQRSITAEEMVNILRQAVPAEEGRKSLAAALTRIRGAGAGDPLAATTQIEANGSSETETQGPPTSRADGGDQPERLDPEQTAPFQALSDDGGDLGKIAFYGRIMLPGESAPPQAKAVSGGPPPNASTPPVPIPAESVTAITTIMTLPAQAIAASAAPTTASTPPVSAPTPPNGLVDGVPTDGSPETPGRRPPRPIPRPFAEKSAEKSAEKIPEKKISGYPTLRVPPPEPETPEEARLLAGDAPVLAAVTVPAPEAAGAAEPSRAAPSSVPPPLPPMPSNDVPVEPSDAARITVASMPANGTGPNLPTVPPPAPPARGFPWALVALVGILLAGGGALFLFHEQTTDTAPIPPVASSTPAAPSASVAPSAAAPSASASAPPAASAADSSLPVAASASAAPVAPGASAAPSAAPSASASAAPSAGPLSSASAAPVASASPPASASSPSAAAPQESAAPAVAKAPEPADSGEVDLPASAAQHRVYIDDKVVSEGAAPIHVHCGSHVLRIGSAGKERTIDVPCGGTLNLAQ